MTRKRQGPVGRFTFGPVAVAMKPLHPGAWDELHEKYKAMEQGPDGGILEALEEIEANHREVFDLFAVSALSMRCTPYPFEKLIKLSILGTNRMMGKSYNPRVQRKHERLHLARLLYLFLKFMKPRWGEATGILERYMMEHGEDVGGAGAVRRCLRAAGYPVPKGDGETFARRYCYRPSRVDAALQIGPFDRSIPMSYPGSDGYVMMSLPLMLPDFVGMVGGGLERTGPGERFRFAPYVAFDPDAPTRLAQAPPDLALVAFLCLCLSHPTEAREMSRTVPKIGNLPDLVEAWRRTLFIPPTPKRPFIHKDGGADPVTGTPSPGAPGTPGECAQILRKIRKGKRHK